MHLKSPLSPLHIYSVLALFKINPRLTLFKKCTALLSYNSSRAQTWAYWHFGLKKHKHWWISTKMQNLNATVYNPFPDNNCTIPDPILRFQIHCKYLKIWSLNFCAGEPVSQASIEVFSVFCNLTSQKLHPLRRSSDQHCPTLNCPPPTPSIWSQPPRSLHAAVLHHNLQSAEGLALGNRRLGAATETRAPAHKEVVGGIRAGTTSCVFWRSVDIDKSSFVCTHILY